MLPINLCKRRLQWWARDNSHTDVYSYFIYYLLELIHAGDHLVQYVFRVHHSSPANKDEPYANVLKNCIRRCKKLKRILWSSLDEALRFPRHSYHSQSLIKTVHSPLFSKSLSRSILYTAISKRLSEKVHATIPKGIVDGFEITVLHRNFERMAGEAMDYVSEC